MSFVGLRATARCRLASADHGTFHRKRGALRSRPPRLPPRSRRARRLAESRRCLESKTPAGARRDSFAHPGLRFRHSTGIFWDVSCKKTSAIPAALREASDDQAAARKSGSPALPAAVYLQLCARCAPLVKIPDWSGAAVAAMTDVRMRCQRRNDEVKGICPHNVCLLHENGTRINNNEAFY